jgi:hypothetical protein
MGNTLTDEATWIQIRDVSFQVVLLTQRADQFWALPTISDEVKKTHAPAGSLDATIRNQEPFGFPSITVTFNALEALAAASGSKPTWVAPAALHAIETFRGKHGGYGTPVPRKDGTGHNVVPRHTAMAVVSNLNFSNDVPSTLIAHARPSIEWLLKNQLRLGGWPYDYSNPEPMLGFLSTASAICALCHFLDCEPTQSALTRGARRAIPKSYDALVGTRHSGVWDGDGSTSDSQIDNAAFGLRLLKLADRRGRLSSLVPEHSPSLNQIIGDFSRTMIDGGWPDRVGEKPISPTSSISGLQLVIETASHAGLDSNALLAVERTILASWKSDELPLAMEAWHWECLALLASAKAGPMSSAAQQTYRSRCEKVRRRWMTGKIRKSDLSDFRGNTKLALEFALTEGGALRGNKFVGHAKRILAKIADDIVVQGVLWVLAALLAYVIYLWKHGSFGS